MRRALPIALFLVFASCKKEESSQIPDAGVVGPYVDRELGLSMLPLPGWTQRAGEPRLDIRRTTQPGMSFLVEPRVVIDEQPIEATMELDAIAQQAVNGIIALGQKGALTVRKSSTSKRVIDGVDVAELELEYRIRGANGEKDVVQRSLICKRERRGLPVAVTITATYVAEAELALGPEIFRILGSLRFQPPEAEAPKDAPDASP